MECDKNSSELTSVSCPICLKDFNTNFIEEHVNKCIFLNSTEEEPQKRKRSMSPTLSKSNTQPKLHLNQKSPNDYSNISKNHIKEQTKILAPLFLSTNKNRILSTPLHSSTNNSEVVDLSDDNKEKEKISLSFNVPLAKQVQPKTLDDFFGQNHVLGKDTVLRSLLEKGEIPNMILWGPPGCGKTSLSGVIHEMCKKEPKRFRFTTLCAATSGVKEVQTIITTAKNELKYNRKTILFMDEIHRFNKKQQDTFLLSVEKGDIILIGATTENPSFSINSALLSRCRVIVLEKLGQEDLYSILEKATETFNVDVVDVENPCGIINDDNGMGIENTALQWLADISDGDARIALGNLQLALQFCNQNGKIINVDDLKDGIKKSHMLYDRAGEEHYNMISAMHKSIRGSHDNAAVYWTTRMIVGGEDPRYIARRLLRAASEDIGNADPQAMQLAVATMQGCELIGKPECEVLLAQCAIYLARAPKSREADTALAKAKELINNCKGVQPSVPMHIRNAPTKLMKDLGYGRVKPGEEFGFMPPELKDVNFFN